MAETDVAVSDNAFTLVELGEMGHVQSLIAVNSVNREILHGSEDGLLGQLVQHA